MGLQDWGAIRSEGRSVVPEVESALLRWGKILSLWLTIAGLIYLGLSHIVSIELLDVEKKVETNSRALQRLEKDVGTLTTDLKAVQKDISGINISLARIETTLRLSPVNPNP